MENIQERTFKLIHKLEELRGNVPQFLLSDDVDGNMTLAVRERVTQFKILHPKSDEVDLIVNSPGGLADDAYRVIRTFRKNFNTVNVIVPYWAKSAATLLSLGGSVIVMDEFGEFGPLDAQLGKERNDSPQIERESALNDEHSMKRIETRFKEMFETLFIRLYEHKKINIPKSELSQQLFKNLSKFYEPLLKQIDPYKLGDKRRKLDIGGQYATRILAQFSPKGEGRVLHDIRRFVDFLVDGCPDHGYVIDYDLTSMFLSNVITSHDFSGPDYSRVLAELSMIMMEQEEISFIGFVHKPKPIVSEEIVAELKINHPIKGKRNEQKFPKAVKAK